MSGETYHLPVWRVASPTRMIHQVEWMSFYALREAERCPLSSVLRRSEYAQLWDRNGYPDKRTLPAAIGIIVHSAAQVLVRELMSDGVTSSIDEAAMITLRRLGGFSKILSEEVARFVAEERANPRFSAIASTFEQSLLTKLARMRELLQELISAQRWIVRNHKSSALPTLSSPTGSFHRFPLSRGTTFEVELRDHQIKWRGRADSITVNADSCAIADMKTGESSDAHIEQLKIYSVLWDGDSELNPAKLPISDLKIFYGSSVTSLDAPTQGALDEWRASIVQRTQTAQGDLGLVPPPARPSSENCKDCQVKLLCNEYWRSGVQESDAAFRDVEMILTSKRGDIGWNAQEIQNGAACRELLFTRSTPVAPYWDELFEGRRVRITGAYLTSRHEDVSLITASALGEALLLESTHSSI